jgi:hypothetical protein
MGEPFYAAAYWGRRAESAEQCAKRAETFFSLLAACHGDYGHWYEQANSTKHAPQLEFEPAYDTFVRFFKKKKYQAGDDGFSFGAWTGHSNNQGGMILLGCGASDEGATNLAQLYFPSEPPGKDRLATLPVVTGVMRALALAWEPEWAVATPRDFRDRLSEAGLPGTFVGWLTYYSRQWGAVPPLPEPVQVAQVEDKGALVVLSPERVDGASEKDVVLGGRIQQILQGSGLLGRVGERLCAPTSQSARHE